MSLNGSALEAELARYGLSLTTRAEWGARAPKSTPSQMTIPSPRVWIHHAAIESSDDGAEMRAHQAFHMDQRGWNDIAYSLCIPDPNPGGVVFEGRGIGIDGGHTATENTESHGLCVLGNFQVDHPSQATIDVLVTLLRAGRIEGWWADPVPATNIGGHRDAPTANTSCPGDHLYDDIPTIRIRATEDDDMPTANEIALEVMKEQNKRYEQSGSTLRVNERELSKLGADDAATKGELSKRLATIESDLDAIKSKLGIA